MKKLSMLLLALTLALTACGGNDNKTEDTKGEEKAATTDTKAEEVKEEVEAKPEIEEEKKPLVTVDKLPYEVKIDEKADSAGSVYAHFTYENKSEYPITAFNLSATLKDQNEKAYYNNFDTVMPGEKSANFEGFGPKTSKKEDIEFLELEYKIKDKKSGKNYLITYNYKLDEYDVLEMSE
ncbi:hypothetical protein GUI37_01495 [Helcococcus kunzii]|uniref:hypothetical protein n=1 Tax=Helcococcus kunzii TaxID=40091 RepID=UPI001BAF6F06|nr:hypothetical protein [Helcococcus kunzii]QUY64260.1 hypothetical protein GUI37_01495 [Helcococcus kunzii]